MRYCGSGIPIPEKILRALKFERADGVAKVAIGHFRSFALALLGAPRACNTPRGDGRTHRNGHQRSHEDTDSSKREFVALDELSKAVEPGWRTSRDWFVVQVALKVGRQTVGCLVTARAIFFQTLHHDPVEVLVDFGLRISDFGFGT